MREGLKTNGEHTMKWFKRIGSAAAVILWYSVIFGFSAQDGEKSGSLSGAVAEAVMKLFGGDPGGEARHTLEHIIRKGAHMTEFAILALLVFWAVYAWTGVRSLKAFVIAFALTVCLASLDEFHQTYVPDRAGRPADVLIDSCGALIALALLWFILRGKNSSINRRKASKDMDK